jgi:hypothetical protein
VSPLSAATPRTPAAEERSSGKKDWREGPSSRRITSETRAIVSSIPLPSRTVGPDEEKATTSNLPSPLEIDGADKLEGHVQGLAQRVLKTEGPRRSLWKRVALRVEALVWSVARKASPRCWPTHMSSVTRAEYNETSPGVPAFSLIVSADQRRALGPVTLSRVVAAHCTDGGDASKTHWPSEVWSPVVREISSRS